MNEGTIFVVACCKIYSINTNLAIVLASLDNEYKLETSCINNTLFKSKNYLTLFVYIYCNFFTII